MTKRSIGILLTVAVATAFGLTALPDVLAGSHQHEASHRHRQTMPDLDLFDPSAFGPAERDPSGQEGSGGRAVAHRSGGRQIGNAAAGPDARLFRTGFGSFEPTLGVTKDGSLFTNALGEMGEPLVIRSSDEGGSWEMVFDGHGITADPYLYVDPDTSRIFANDLLPPCHLISHSDDLGETWTTAPPASCGFNEDHQTIFSGPAPEGGTEPEGYPNVVYLCSLGGGISIASTASVCSKSLDGGVTFLPTGAPAFNDDPRQSGDFGVPGLCNGANAHGYVGPDGTVYLPRGWCGQPWLAISKDEGTTWTRVQVADNGMACCAKVEGQDGELYSHEAGVVADGSGNIYYTWVALDRLPYLAISRDGGETWSEPMMIGPPGIRETLLPGIALGAKGKIIVQYMGSSTSPWNGEAAEGSYENATWNGYVTMTTQALHDDPLFYSATINDPADPLWRGECGPDPIRCAWGDFLDVVIDRDGRPWWVAVDLCAGQECGGSGEAIIGSLVGGPRLR